MKLTKVDPYDNKEFVPHRTNQVFKNRANQIAYNNMKAKQKRQGKAHIDAILTKNRDALLELLGNKNEAMVSTTVLTEKGINTNYHTHAKKYGNTSAWCVYEIEMYRIGDEQIKLVNSCANQNS